MVTAVALPSITNRLTAAAWNLRSREKTLPAADAQLRLCGATNRNDYVGDVRVEASGDALFLVLGPSGNGDSGSPDQPRPVCLQPGPAPAAGSHGRAFLMGAAGKASAATIEDLNDYGLGTLAWVGAR